MEPENRLEAYQAAQEAELEHLRSALARSSLQRPAVLIPKVSQYDISQQYWSSCCLSYDDTLGDGFYELFGEFPDCVPQPDDFPSLEALSRIHCPPGCSRVVVLFDRRVDPGLQEICEEAAEAAAAARAAAPHSVLAPYRALAQVVAGRLGGPQAANMPLVERIKIALESLNHGGIGTVICPIGDIFLAGPRPRATLFKFLADQLGLKVRVVKGRFYADSDDDARVIIPMDNKDMHLDLMTRPGATSVLAEKLALRASSREQTGAHWRSSSVSEPAEAAPEVPHLPASAAHANTSLGMASVGAGGHQANGLSVEHLAPVAEGQPDDISRPESVEHGINFMSIEEAMQMAAAAAMSGPPGPAAAPLFIPGQLPPAALQQAAPVVTSSLTRSAPGAGFVRMLSRGSSSSLPSAMSGGLMPPSPYEMAPLPAAVRTSMDREGTAAEQAESSQNSEFLAEVGPPALVSDASGQQYIMQPVRASLDYSQLAGWGDGGMPRRDSLGAGPRAGDRVQAKRASSLRPGLPDIPSLGIDGDVEVTLVPGNAPAESGTPTPKLEGTADSMMHWAVMQAAAATAAGAYGGAKQAAESSVPFPQQLRASGVSNVDLSRLYLDGLMQNGSVRMSVPVEFEQRQALLNRTAKVTSSGSTLDDDTSPPLADAKPASRSSGGGVPFPAASMSPGREGHDLAKDNSTDIYTPFSQVQAPLTSAESTVPSVSSESTPHLSNQHSQEPEGEASLRSASATEKSLARALSLHRRGSGQVAQVAARLNSMASAGVSIHSYAGSDEDDTWEIDPSELQFGPRIGMGSYGEVFRGSWRQTDIAIKRLFDQSINPRIVDGFKKEVSIMKRMRHPNIVQFMGACTKPPNLMIVTEFVPRGSLFKLLHRSPDFTIEPRRRLQMALDVARGMNYLHTCRPPIVHRDLKSPNLLVDKDMSIKVCDFGLSRVRRATVLSAKSQAGTPEWTAPEVLQSHPCSEASDVYSFGVILWELLTGQEPWTEKTAMQVVGSVGFSGERLPVPKDANPVLQELMRRCFSDPDARPMFSEIIPVLKKCVAEGAPGNVVRRSAG